MDLLNRYMEDIESRIQPEEEQSIWAAWMEFAQGACKSGPICSSRAHATPFRHRMDAHCHQRRH